MSFSFGFTGDSDDELDVPSTTQTGPFVNPLDTSIPDARPAMEESLTDLITSLKDVRVTFEKYTTPQGNVVYRRELFDVKHQLMAEDDDDTTSDELKILIGNDATDLKKNVYEGGLKSWECSIDTVDMLSRKSDDDLIEGDIVELGCGTALPSTYLFKRALQAKKEKKLTFVLSDYNHTVLRLVTLPNIIITWAMTLTKEQRTKLQTAEDDRLPIVDDELQLTKQLLTEFVDTLTQQGISLRFISGTWGREFVNIVNASSSSPVNLIITSETIYAPETLPVISEVLIELLKHNKTTHNNSPTAVVAAKDIYFGVGGSVVEFENYLQQRQSQGVDISFDTQKANAGLKRSIVVIK